ncbi:hypothetical protein [Ferrimonas balearica]|uniref:hypothetical protein n=1 Tax=Ferrimonas balearica TaxID=44012 RepID=UPI001C9A2AF7|nr:hypothetical protein [Ferrimonas balearica]MBY5920796.1 hypothetical protein [Ferrimonas balearica]
MVALRAWGEDALMDACGMTGLVGRYDEFRVGGSNQKGFAPLDSPLPPCGLRCAQALEVGERAEWDIGLGGLEPPRTGR